MTIPLAIPTLAGNEATYLQECVDTNFVSSVGPFVERFEREFAAHVGSRHAVACSTGTAALHVALRLTGAAPGRLVAVSDFTFIASANAAAYTGADILLVDAEPATWNMDTERLHDEVTRRADRGHQIPDVIEVVHVLGHPASMEPLLALRDRFGTLIVEDAAEALGATYVGGDLDGRHVGTIGDLGCFSFNGNKIITAGGGGMIVTEDPELADHARHLTTQAKVDGREYLHDEVGYNYRLTNTAAALGVAQLEQLPEFLRRKREIAATYRHAFSDLPVVPSPHADWAAPSFWLSSVLLDNGRARPAALDALSTDDIGARPLWPPLHLQQPYADTDRIGGKVAKEIHERGISLPSSTGLTAWEQREVIDSLCRFFATA